MDTPWWSWLLYLCFAAAFLTLSIGWQRKLDEVFEARRSAALVQFRAWLASPAAAQLNLGPANEIPVLVREYSGSRESKSEHYSLTWYLRNAEGQYLMLISTENEKPFVKLLEDRYARVVLKKRYRRP